MRGRNVFSPWENFMGRSGLESEDPLIKSRIRQHTGTIYATLSATKSRVF
jgi:hypothetical protein